MVSRSPTASTRGSPVSGNGPHVLNDLVDKFCLRYDSLKAFRDAFAVKGALLDLPFLVFGRGLDDLQWLKNLVHETSGHDTQGSHPLHRSDLHSLDVLRAPDTRKIDITDPPAKVCVQC